MMEDFPLTVHLINRADRPNRLMSALKELRSLEITYQINIINAVTPSEAHLNRHRYITGEAYQNITHRGPSHKTLITWGSVACAASHYRCWYDISWSNPSSFHLIVEDDIIFTDQEKFKFHLVHALDILKSEFSVSDGGEHSRERPAFFLFNSKSADKNNTNASDTLNVSDVFTGLHCYLMNTPCAKYLSDNCKRFTYQADIQLGLMAKEQKPHQFGLRAFNFPNSGTSQNTGFTSDVQPQKTTKLFLQFIFPTLPEHICEMICDYLKMLPQDIYNSCLPNHTCSMMSNYYY